MASQDEIADQIYAQQLQDEEIRAARSREDAILARYEDLLSN